MHNKEKARIAAEIKAFKNTDFTDCPEMTDEQLAQLRPSHYRKMKEWAEAQKQEPIEVECKAPSLYLSGMKPDEDGVVRFPENENYQ